MWFVIHTVVCIVYSRVQLIYCINTPILCHYSGRGFQLNEGAGASKHKLLLFLHIDTVLPKHFDTMAWHTLLIPGVTAGAFQFGLDVVHMKEKR